MSNVMVPLKLLFTAIFNVTKTFLVTTEINQIPVRYLRNLVTEEYDRFPTWEHSMATTLLYTVLQLGISALT